MADQGCDVGLVGLGVMGQNFVLNMADHGFSVAVYNRTGEKTREFVEKKVEDRDIRPGYTLEEFVGLLSRPRSLIIMVSAGEAVDAVIAELLLHLESGDLIIDSGNSHFKDTDRRTKSLGDKGVLYMGMGISGGEKGARYGPSLMPGGPKEAYDRVKRVLEASAAKVDGDPCVTYLGTGSAGHYVKMIHNGIEYGIMQLLAETYDLMKRGLGLDAEELHRVYDEWNKANLNSYLVEITSHIFLQKDEKTGRPLVDLILDKARQKGTGKWTSMDSMELQVPTPTIDVAVAMRVLSDFKEERGIAARTLKGPERTLLGDRALFVKELEHALYASMIITYAQGMALLRKASRTYGYELDLEAVARIWRGGCIIRAALLEDIRSAYQAAPDLSHLLMDAKLGQKVVTRQEALRSVLCKGANVGIPLPGLMMCLAYFDAYRSAWLPANLTQAQRDYFGSHTYQRVDSEEIFHTEWVEE